jgi:hypothetical protein
MTYKELLKHLDAGTLRFCPPPADAYFEPEFVKTFVRDVFGLDWEYCGCTSETRLSDFVEIDGTRALLERIRELYGADCSDVPELNFWLCLKRCESAAERSNAESRSREAVCRSMERRVDACDSIDSNVRAKLGS